MPNTTANAIAQEQGVPPYLMKAAEVQQQAAPTGYVWLSSNIAIPHFSMPDDAQPGDEFPILLNAVVHVEANFPYAAVKILDLQLEGVHLVAEADG